MNNSKKADEMHLYCFFFNCSWKKGVRKIAHKENYPQSGSGFGLGIVLELGLGGRQFSLGSIFLEPEKRDRKHFLVYIKVKEKLFDVDKCVLENFLKL